ncbi:MAG: hypothetical protein BAA01_07720 [Bacillus thermozeamaize]|uniref:Stage III sporulation protein AH n=1 Tax=Bacillus thermozeamaize TaxID=230954 RepID=A0A1Y3PBV3_9BACI|nr:MAG: hypothetical protein BAA01_07720 [Bacillus thermozeamaize]
MPKKQTIWLISLLGLMVLLSAYYLLTEPVDLAEPADAPKKDAQTQGQQAAGEQPEGKTEEPLVDLKAAPVSFEKNALNDFFYEYRMQRNIRREEQIERLLNIVSNTEATNEAIADANRQLKELYAIEDKQYATEEMIKLEGYDDVVVIPGDGKVNVIVKADQLTPEQALKIMNIVSQNMNVSAANVVVKFKS